MAQYNDESPVVEYALTGNPFTDSLFDPQAYFRNQWSTVVGGKTSVTYSFAWEGGVASKFIDTYGDEPTATTTGTVTSTEAPGITLAFQRWADVANITFTKVAETAAGQVGDIRIGFSSAVGSGFWGYTKIVSNGAENTFPANNTQGDIWIALDHKGESFAETEYNFTAMMHEIGHALGLDHPFQGNIIPAGYDNQRYTIMSYTDPDNVYYYNPGTKEFEYLIKTPMVYDIAAIQHIYGANTKSHAGNDTYAYDPTKPFFATIWDGGGVDTIDVSAFAKACKIDLREGQYSTLGFSVTNLTDNLGIAFDCFIENAKGGSAADTLTGNELANTINGNGGDDTIDGVGGNDILNGGDGTDTASYASAAVGVTVSLAITVAQNTVGAGRDTLGGFENLRGSAFVDKLAGNSGNNTLIGGAGADIMRGGTGDDTYFIENIRDKAVELVGAGTDTVVSGVSLTLLANVENLTLSGSALIGKGNALGNALTGTTANNGLYGLAGDDTLAGSGGADTLTGGAGRDMMTGGDGADRFIFAAGDFAGASDGTCDAILDFRHSDHDRIHLGLVDANTINANGNDAFVYIGSAEFHHTAGELRWFANGANHYDVQGDTNGDGIADFWIAVTSSTALVRGDFTL